MISINNDFIFIREAYPHRSNKKTIEKKTLYNANITQKFEDTPTLLPFPQQFVASSSKLELKSPAHDLAPWI